MSNNQLHFDVLKFIDSKNEVRGKDIIEKFKNTKAQDLTTIVSKLKYQKFIQGSMELELSNKSTYSTLSEGKFKLLDFEQFRLAKRNFWLAFGTAILMAIISIGGIMWDSVSDQIWQKEQIELLQQQNKILENIIRQGA